MFNTTVSSGINSSVSVEGPTAEIISHQIGNASNVPEEHLDVAESHVHQILERPIAITTELDHAQVEHLKIDVGNITTTFAILPQRLFTEDSSETGKILWNFSGKDELRTVTLRVEDRTWHEQFARLRLPTSPLLLGETDLRPKAHQAIYENLCTALEPVDGSAPGNVIILQGASGLGKTYCAQHYFYHQAAQQHQMVAWLTGTSKEDFLQGWAALAQQLRTIDAANRAMNNDAIIKHWCENQLGQWLLIIDEVHVDAEWLREHLPQKGGHVVITTHRLNYRFHPSQQALNFYPLSKSDSQNLLQVYVGQHWQTSGHSQEQEALNYLCVALGGFPVALTQMALLAHKKSISFERLANQFKQPQLRAYLLNDAIYDQLKNRTFISSVQKGWQQLLTYFAYRYPQLRQEQHEQHLRQFFEYILNPEFDGVINNESIEEYWQAIGLSCSIDAFDSDEIMNWLICLPLQYEKDTQQWLISLAGISALRVVSDKKPLSVFSDIFIEKIEQAPLPVEEDLSQASSAASATVLIQEAESIPKIPESMLMSISLEDSRLRNVEITIATVGRPSEFTAWQLPTRNPYFIPRPKLVEALMQKLPIKEKGETSAQLLLTAATGMGGIGKTELARHYVTEGELSGHYHKRFWVTATSDSMLRLEFQQFAAYLGLIELEKYIEDEELIMRVHKWLSIHPGWLMVLDNADDYNSIERWIPREGGAVLITTREPTPGTLSHEQIIPVPLLDHDEAVLWLYQLSGRQAITLSVAETIAAEKLIDDLGCLPLAIAQAAAYLREQSATSIEAYQANFMRLLSDTTLAQQGSAQVVEKNSDTYSRLIVANTWTISLQAIETYNEFMKIPNMAKLLLNSCAYLASKDIPILLLEYLLKNLTSDAEHNLVGYALDEYIGQLIRYSLVERNDKNNLSMHSLSQEVFREKQTIKERKISLRYISFSFDQIIDNKDGFNTSLSRDFLTHGESLYEHCMLLYSLSKEQQDSSKIWEIFPVQLMNIYNNLGLWNRDKGFIESILPIAVSYYGEEDVNIFLLKAALAVALEKSGNYVEAIAIYKFLLPKIIVHYQTENHINVAKIQKSLGDVLVRQGNYEAAEKIYKKALSTMDKLHSKKIQPRVAIMQALAGVYQRVENYGQSKMLYTEALIIVVQYYKTDFNIEAAIIQSNLGSTLIKLEQYDEAAKLLYQALETKIKHYLSEYHISVAETQQNLGIAMRYLKNYVQAEQFCRQALKTRQEYYQTIANIDVADSQISLADVIIMHEKYPEAVELYRQALKTRKEHYQMEHCIHVATVQEKLADALDQKDGFFHKAEIEKLYDQALKTKIAHHKTYLHIEVANSQVNLSVFLLKSGKLMAAEKLLKQALATNVEYYKTDENIHVARVQQNYAKLLEAKCEYYQAEILYRKSLTTSSAYYKTHQNIEVALMQTNLAFQLCKLNNLDEAYLLLQESENTFATIPEGYKHLSDCKKLKDKVKSELFFSLKNQAYESLRSFDDENAAFKFESLISLFPEKVEFVFHAASVYHVLSIRHNENNYFIKSDIYFKKSLFMEHSVEVEMGYANFLRNYGQYSAALKILDDVLRLEVSVFDNLSYGPGEAIVLPTKLQSLVEKQIIIIPCAHFFAYYLKVICLLEQDTIEKSMAVAGFNEFIAFANVFRASNPESFLPIYDWFLQNARELITKKQEGLVSSEVGIESSEDWAQDCHTLFAHGYRFSLEKRESTLKVTRIDEHVQHESNRQFCEKVRSSCVFFMASGLGLNVADSTEREFTLKGDPEVLETVDAIFREIADKTAVSASNAESDAGGSLCCIS